LLYWRPDVSIVALLIAGIAGAYQVLAIAAAVRHLLTRKPSQPKHLPPISILKPIRGLDPSFREAIRSHAAQDYPQFEILFGVLSLDDPAVPEIRRLIADFPAVAIRLLECTTSTPNAKVGVMMELAAAARHPVLLVNDSDIRVPQGYLRGVWADLNVPGTGLVTCLYTAEATSLPGHWEALGISTDFAPSILVARVVGVREFGMGSTLCFRREHLEQIGSFAVIADYLADDYQLAKRITELGLTTTVSQIPVTTHVGDDTWAGVWRHQVRWARTIRVSKGGGYLGLPVTHAGLWALLLAAMGAWWPAAILWALRILAGLATGVLVLGNWRLLGWTPIIPLWDPWAFAVWLAGLSGDTVTWRGRRIRLTPDGRIPH
jgi:ceramide glucosyltransferase